MGIKLSFLFDYMMLTACSIILVYTPLNWQTGIHLLVINTHYTKFGCSFHTEYAGFHYAIIINYVLCRLEIDL